MAAFSRSTVALLLAFVVARVSGASLPLPDFIKGCSKDDPKLNECALEQGKPAFSKMKEGLPKYHVPRLEPLRVDEIRINQDENAGVSINLVAKEVDLHGVSEGQLRGISIQVDPPVFKMKFFFPRIEMNGKYNIDGKILILPIQGDGDANITMVNLDMDFDFEGEWITKDDGHKYLKMNDHHMTYKMDRNYIRLDNLFNGNKALGDRMNEFLDQNWREVTAELGPPIADAIALVIKSIITGIFDRVPYENVFPEKA